MKEDPHPIPRLLLFLLTGSFATLATFAVVLGGALSLWLQGHLSKSQVLGMALGLAGILLVAVWIGVIAARRQRAKIEALEADILSLKRPPSPELPKQYSAEQHAMLIQLAKSSTRNGNVTHQETLAVLQSLESAGLINRRHNEFDVPWWELNKHGREYLKDCGLI